MPPSPLEMQVLFIGGTDMVQTTETYGNAAGEFPAKQWHDFIGFTPDNDSDDLGWVSVNHEMIQNNPNIGDGGGMTAFKVRRDPNTDTLIVLEQTLEDGRQGKFFNVDFVNTVGETGMNCGGITGPNGRIWTAEEWFRTSNASFPVTDTSDVLLPASLTGWEKDTLVKKYQTVNYMVEIDPRQAVALRKQYAWGRQAFEGGAFLPDERTVILGVDNSPGPLTKFVADVAGDYSQGTLYCYKQDNPVDQRWIELPNTAGTKLDIIEASALVESTIFARIEWVTYDDQTGRIYMTETGRDNIGSRFARSQFVDRNATPAAHHFPRAEAQGLTNLADDNYSDF